MYCHSNARNVLALYVHCEGVEATGGIAPLALPRAHTGGSAHKPAANQQNRHADFRTH